MGGYHRSWLLLLLVVINLQLLSADTDTINAVSKAERKAFAALVKAVRSQGGYVHPSIDIVSPAPESGAPRGIAIVKKVTRQNYDEEDILIKVPYSYQMSRELAYDTLLSVIPEEVLIELPLVDLDDAALLVLLLSHEYGLGKKSKFNAYIRTLPMQGGGCGWAQVDDLRHLPNGVDVDDLERATMYAHRVANGMAKDYGAYLAKSSWPKEWKEDPSQALLWALCIVNSRATAAYTNPGRMDSPTGVRLVPIADMANHFSKAGNFTELSEPSNDIGAFVVQSVWKCGTSRDIRVGNEITVNYNLKHFGAIDWFLSLGFIPPEVATTAQYSEL